MATMGQGSKTAWKERKKAIARGARERKEYLESLDKLQGIDKLKFEIEESKHRIANCKYDLSKNPDSEIIKYKLEVLMKSIEDKTAELNKLIAEKNDKE